VTERPRNPAETSDGALDRELDLAAIVKTGVGLAVVVVAAAALMYWLASGLRASGERHDPPRPVLVEAQVQQPPPEPRLQEDPEEELAALRAEEDALLDGYAWVDEAAGIARIPVARAIEILAADGGAAAGANDSGETP